MKTTIVMVHGAFAESASWDRAVGPLQRAGHTVMAVPNPLRGVAEDAAYVTDAVRSVEGPVLLVAHSYGGAVITDVPRDAADLVGLVYVGGFAPDVGDTAASLSGKFAGSTLADTLVSVPLSGGSADLYIAQDRFHAQFAADLPEEVSARMAATQRPIRASAFDDGARDPLWKHVPSWFFFGELDRNIPVEAHRFMAERAGSSRTVEVAGASHVVGISHADELVELILQATTSGAAAPA